jgi:hypothetical protein
MFIFTYETFLLELECCIFLIKPSDGVNIILHDRGALKENFTQNGSNFSLDILRLVKYISKPADLFSIGEGLKLYGPGARLSI